MLTLNIEAYLKEDSNLLRTITTKNQAKNSEVS